MNEVTHHLGNDSPSFHPVHTLIRAVGPPDLHHAKGRGQRNLNYHPHVHLIVPAGALDERSRQWRQKRHQAKVLFWVKALSRVFRAKWFEAMRLAGLHCQETLPDDWVVHCKKVGRGEQALLYLGRYLYRGVLPEKNIIAERVLGLPGDVRVDKDVAFKDVPSGR